MAAYRQVNDSRHQQADCQEPGSAAEPYARQSSMGYIYLTCFVARANISVYCAVCGAQVEPRRDDQNPSEERFVTIKGNSDACWRVSKRQ